MLNCQKRTWSSVCVKCRLLTFRLALGLAKLELLLAKLALRLQCSQNSTSVRLFRLDGIGNTIYNLPVRVCICRTPLDLTQNVWLSPGRPANWGNNHCFVFKGVCLAVVYWQCICVYYSLCIVVSCVLIHIKTEPFVANNSCPKLVQQTAMAIKSSKRKRLIYM